MPFDMDLGNGMTFAQAMAPKINVKKKIEDKRWTTAVDITIEGQKKTVYYFARVQEGFPFFRLEAALKLLNTEIDQWPEEEREQVYRTHMVDQFFEKMTTEFHYEKKNPETKMFDFLRWDKVSTRFGQNQVGAGPGLTDAASANEMEMSGIAQKGLLPRTKKGEETALKASREAHEIIAADLAKKAAIVTATKEKAERIAAAKAAADAELAEALETAAQLSREAEESRRVAEATKALAAAASAPAMASSVGASSGASNDNTNVFDQAFMTQTSVIDISQAEFAPVPSSVAVAVASSSKDALSQTFASVRRDSDSNNNTPPETAPVATAGTSDNLNYTFQPEPQPQFGTDDLIFSLGSDATFVTKEYLRSELSALLQTMLAAMTSNTKEIKEDNEDKFKRLDKKIDNKFATVLEMKKDLKGMNSKLVGVTEQVSRNSPQKSISHHIQANMRGRYILLRLIPFNYMGKACDVFFASPFVQEQLCAFLTPHLHKMQFAGINFALAKTCIVTFFTPLARAHLIYGKIDNSYKNLLFYKRALPDGLHNMVDKFLVMVIEELLNLSAQVHRDHITDMRACCTTTFTTDRSRFLQYAADSFMDVADGARAVAEEDFKFYEANKHCLKRSGKSQTKVSSFDEHVQYLLKRQHFLEAKKLQDAGTFKQSNFVSDPNDVFAELKKPALMEEMDVKEVLRRICAAAHCFNLDYSSLEFDKLPNVPELPTLYREVVQEINGNINELLAKYSAEGASYQPSVFVGNISGSPTKKTSQGKSASSNTSTASSSSTSTIKKAKRSLQKSMLTDSEDDDDESASSVSSKRKRTTAGDDIEEENQPSKRISPLIIPSILPPVQSMTSAEASQGSSTASASTQGTCKLTPSSDEGGN